MKNIVLPDYDHCLMNIATTVLDHYHVKTPYQTLPTLKKELDKGYRNVVVILIDAMGAEILKKHADVTPYMSQHMQEVLTTVFPSTTVSATTSILTGQPPVVNGWIGWLQYVKEEDRSVIFFLNKDFYDDTHEFNYNVSEKFVPVTKVYQKIEAQNTDVKAVEVFPEFRTPKHKTFSDLCQTILETTQEPGKHYIYAYWDKVDTYLHANGTTSEIVHNHLEEIDKDMRTLIESLDDDTIVVVTADHGQIDIDEIELWNYQDIIDTFEHKPSIEARATAFFIKDGMKEAFAKAFNKHFGDSFILYTSEDFLNAHYLGHAKEHPKLKEFLGDFFSVAIDKYSFKLSDSKRAFKAQHAGLTKDEMLIPLILFSPKK